MEKIITWLLIGSPLFSIALFGLWIMAERRTASLGCRIGLGVAALFTALPLLAAFAVGVTQLDDQSYYAASVHALLDETISALESGEPVFLQRIKLFRDHQVLSYETRGNLLENAREFRDAGRIIRGESCSSQQSEHKSCIALPASVQ